MEELKIVIWSRDKTRKLLKFTAEKPQKHPQKDSTGTKKHLKCLHLENDSNSNRKKSIAKIVIGIERDPLDRVSFSFQVDSSLEKPKTYVDSDSKKHFMWTDSNSLKMHLTCLPTGKIPVDLEAAPEASKNKRTSPGTSKKNKLGHLLSKRKMPRMDSLKLSKQILKNQSENGSPKDFARKPKKDFRGERKKANSENEPSNLGKGD